jgi:hypothetical protein
METNSNTQTRADASPPATGLSVSLVRTVAWTLAVAALIVGPSYAQVPKSEEIQRRYIPDTELSAVMQGDRHGALLPVADFETLLREAQANSATQPALPDGAVVARSDYAAVIDNDRLRLTARIEIRTFKTGWQTARISVAGLGVLSSKIEAGAPAEGQARSAPIARNPENPDELIVFFSEPGTHNLVLELTAPLNAVASDQLAAFGLTGAPAGELTLEVTANKRLSVDGAQLVRAAADEEAAKYTVPIGNHRQIQLAITERRSGNQADATTFASTAIGVKASPGEATWTARTRLSVFGRPLDRPNATSRVHSKSPTSNQWGSKAGSSPMPESAAPGSRSPGGKPSMACGRFSFAASSPLAKKEPGRFRISRCATSRPIPASSFSNGLPVCDCKSCRPPA